MKLKLKLKLPKLPIIFPHISHRIPEWPQIKLVGWNLLLIVLILNILFALLPPISEELKLRQNVTKDPFSRLPHQKLAEYYLDLNLTEAEKEFYLAESFYPAEQASSLSTNLLGVESSPLSTWNNLLNYREKIIDEINYWEALGKKYPEYEYGSLKLATLYYRLGEHEKARTILQKLLSQNPTLEAAQTLYSKLN